MISPVAQRALDKIFKRDFARFLVSGGFNTALTYGVYLLLLNVVPYKISYTIAYISGILLVVYSKSIFVF